jgi:transposase InsO family protein
MTREQYLINRKLNILDLGHQLENISGACRRLGISRQHFYDIKKAVEEEGVQGLLEKSRKAARVRNRVAPDVEEAILEYSLQYPTHGQVRVANELKKSGQVVSSGGVRTVWMRHDLQVKGQRLKRLEKWAAENTNILTESQVDAMERVKEVDEAHGEIETFHPGFLVAQDTCYVGTIKGVGRIYQQTGIDTYSNVGFAKVYSEKTALVAADFLNDKVLPFFDERWVKVLRVLTDRGTEYNGLADNHPYELFLHLNGIDHSTTKVRHPQTNGCAERLNQIIQDEFYAVAFRRKLYSSLEEIQVDLDQHMLEYNTQRTNQGKRCLGRTPMETFEAGKDLCEKYVPEPAEEVSVA